MLCCCMLWCEVIWYDVIRYAVIWYGMLWYDMLWCDMMWYNVIWCSVMWCVWSDVDFNLITKFHNDKMNEYSTLTVLFSQLSFFIQLHFYFLFNEAFIRYTVGSCVLQLQLQLQFQLWSSLASIWYGNNKSRALFVCIQDSIDNSNFFFICDLNKKEL